MLFQQGMLEMEQEKPARTDHGSRSIDGSTSPQEQGTGDTLEVQGGQARTNLQPASPASTQSQAATPTTVQDLADLPRLILPEETYRHLRNAGREAVLALVSLMESLNSSLHRSSSGRSRAGKVRKQIDVE